MTRGQRRSLRILVSAGLLLFAGLLASCATAPIPKDSSNPGVSFADGDAFGPKPEIVGPDELHRLDERQRQDFLAYLHDPANATTGIHYRVYHYLKDVTSGFNYQGATLTAAETLAGRTGNCLSLAILTTALAKVAGVDTDYQLLDDVPVFEFDETIVKKGVHVRSILYDPEWEPGPLTVSSRPGVRIDYFPSRRERFIGNLDEDGYVAMYYRNIAAEAIGSGDYSKAYWYTRESLQYAEDHEDALNMLAVIHSRVGNPEKAEEIYLYAIERAENKLSLLKNYHGLLARTGRDAEAQEIEQRLDRMKDPSPYHWFRLARAAYEDNEYFDAIDYFNRAVDRAPYLHEAHVGLARAYYQVGRLRNAEAALQTALDKAFRRDTRNLYQAKLEALRREADP